MAPAFPWARDLNKEYCCEASAAISTWKTTLLKHQQEWKQFSTFKSNLELSFNPEAEKEEGERRLKQLNWLLDHFRLPDGSILKRTRNQKAWHRKAIAAELPKIYGKSWDRVAATVLKEWRIAKLQARLLIFSARREGKTFMISMLAAASSLVIPGFEITIFSVNQRIAHKLMETTLSFIHSVPGAASRIVQNTKENLYIAAQALADGFSIHSQQARELAGAGSTSKIHCYPNNPDGQLQSHTYIHTRGEREIQKVSIMLLHIFHLE